ncbi:MAG: ABC transporter substrate-binding protein [Gammaproteobacteria bacterium]|nr:ABC transporter substrate-binding protein [Gammaproteobacteria bacterium]
MRPGRRFLASLVSAMVAVSVVRAAEISISCGAVGRELALCRSGAEAWAAATGNTVRVVTAPSATNERLALYQQLLAARAPDVDIFQIDVIWPGILGAHFADLGDFIGEQRQAFFPEMVANDTVEGRLVAIPWFASVGMLYYRKDLLDEHGRKVPGTWAELGETARGIQAAERGQGNAKIWGYVWQGRAYEGLTCNALEWIDSHGGGTIVDPDGKVTVDNAHAIAAVEQAADWVGTISPKGVLNYAEEDARGVFQPGNAVFMRNWPYAWALMQAEDSPVRGRVGVAPLPAGGEDGQRAATLGGWQLAVSRYSRHPELAADLVLHLTSAAEQRRRAIDAAYIPTRPALFEDAEVLEANPFFRLVAETLPDAVARPSAVTGAAYNRVSNQFWNTVHGVLAGRVSASAGLTKLQRDLNRLKRRGGW